MNAGLLLVLSSSPNFESFVDAQSLLLVISGYAIFETTLFYTVRNYSEHSPTFIRLLPLIFAIAQILYCKYIITDNTHIILYSVYILLRMHLAYIEIIIEFKISKRSHIVKYIIITISGFVSIFCFYLQFTPLQVIYIFIYTQVLSTLIFILSFISIAKLDFDLVNKHAHEKSFGFMVKVIISILSGYILTSHLLLQVRNSDPDQFSKWALSFTIINLIITLASVRNFSLRTESGKITSFNINLIFISTISLFTIAHFFYWMLEYIESLSFLLSRLPHKDNILLLTLITTLGAFNSILALRLRRVNVEPTIITSSLVIFIAALYELNVITLVNISSYLHYVLSIYVICFIEIYIRYSKQSTAA